MQPRFFLDRNLGTRVVPGLLAAAGWHVSTLTEVFGERRGQAVPDEEWLEYAGTRGLIVLMKDRRIRYRAVESAALVRYGVVAFCLTQGALTGEAQAGLFLRHQKRIFAAAEEEGPALYMVSRDHVRRVDLDH